MAHIIKKGPIKVPTQPKDFDLQATGLVFKSYDNQIALEFNVLQQDGAPADLLGANLRLLMFIYDEVDGAIKKEPIPFITKNLITESFLNGHVVYILPEAMKAYNGMVEAYVYIEYPDGSTSDNLGFTFRMKRSTIDGLAQDKADYFIADFQQLLDGVKQEATDAVNEVLEHANQKITEYDQKFQQTAQNIATLDQNFTELRNDMKLSEAWAWSKDGTDRFTTVYPGENYVLKSKEPYTATGNGESNQYPASIKNIPFNPDILGKQATIQYKLTISNYVSGDTVDLKMYQAVGVWSSHGTWTGITGNGTKLVQWKGTLRPLKEGGRPKIDFFTNLKADIKIEELRINEGTEYQIYTPAPSEDPLNAYPQYRGLALLPSDLPDDYSWDITPEYTEKGLNDTVSLTEPQSIDGTKNFLETPLVNGKNVLVEEKPLPYEAWHSTGTELPGTPNKARLIIGPVATTIGAKLNRSMKENPLTWNSGNWQATANRDCTLLVEGLVRYQFGGSTAGQYGYITFYKDDAQTSSIGFAGGVGTNGTVLQWKQGLHFSRIFALKKGEYFNITFETQDGKKLDFSQINTLHIMEIES
ncbi:TPA: BppU family phage baseplate upper protein [Enterococcus faecium]|uniref:BppU family phage baseplate upper protein n=1 Tax=Enterococcus faecium TaxID=1352 RepID=UPI0027B411F2|nr:BppU family phage baseplate upper protein [Enterococcus faecium]MDQ2047669.1 BppU family phage baseplate upper protein [Enterococcus faecium]